MPSSKPLVGEQTISECNAAQPGLLDCSRGFRPGTAFFTI
jgi:hypothetical protein